MNKTYNFTYSGTKNGRLDQVLLNYLSAEQQIEISRSKLKNLIESGKVKLNQQLATKAGTPVKIGNIVEFEYVPTGDDRILAHHLDLEILHEDLDILVINKPAGIVVHPGAGNKSETLLNVLVGQVEISGLRPEYFVPGMPHRLDKDTTGVMVLTKTDLAKSRLSKQFTKHSVDRAYLALAFYTPRSRRPVQLADAGQVHNYIGRDPHNRIKMAVLHEGGREAITNWQVLERFHYGVLLECRLQTGRTHQIRVHLASLAAPIIGDRTYGDFTGLPRNLEILSDQFGRQALHAKELGFYHPVTLKKMFFEVPPPVDFQDLVQSFRQHEI